MEQTPQQKASTTRLKNKQHRAEMQAEQDELITRYRDIVWNLLQSSDVSDSKKATLAEIYAKIK